MIRFALAVLALLLVGGCTTATLKSSFVPEEAAFINTAGKGAIEGQAFLRRNDGIVVYAAGSEVRLIPASAYAQERMNAIYRGGRYVPIIGMKRFENDDPRYHSHMKTTVADGEGRFVFANLAPGRYYLQTTVTWTPDPRAIFPEGGGLLNEVTVSESAEPVRVIMSGQ